MEKHQNYDFILRNQKFSLKTYDSSYIIVLSTKKNSEWIESLQVPLISMENGLKYDASRITKLASSKNQFRIILENSSIDGIKISMEAFTNITTSPWIHFRTSIIFEKGFRYLREAPEIKLGLLPKPDSSNNMVTIKQPTRHTPATDEWKSNDMPATYVWNPQSSVACLFFVDFSQMNWMSSQTFERFSVYECGLDSDGFFGLINRVPLDSPVKIPPGFNMIFDFYITQEYRETKPDKWQAVETLVSKCFKLLPGYVPFPKDDLSWTTFSKECINDLLKEKYCWEDPDFPKYHAYVMDDAELKRRETIGRTNIFETMTMLDVLPPWILYLQLKHDQKQEDHVRRACESLKDFIDSSSNVLYNNINSDYPNDEKFIKPTKSSIGDSWYFFEPITRFGWLNRFSHMISCSPGYISVFENMVNKSRDFVIKHNYEITAFYDPFTLKPLDEVLRNDNQRTQLLTTIRGKDDVLWKRIAKNYACLGIYIYIMIQAYYFFGDDQYLEEAEKSAKKFMHFSPDECFWEPLEIAYGVAGFAELYRITNERKYLKFSNNLILNELRMFYWYDDNSFDWKGKRNNLGLVMACVGIRYPAMKENIESVYPWLLFIKVAIETSNNSLIPKGLFKIFNLIRINSFYHFSSVLPKDFIYPPRQDSPCSFIPFEDLEMLETPPHFSKSQPVSPKGKRTGVLGREIYGAGEVIWLFLMFEALAICDNRKVMLLNLDLFDFAKLTEFPPKQMNFIAYNPLSEPIKCKSLFQALINGVWNIEVRTFGTNKIIKRFQIDKGDFYGIPIELKGEEVLIIEIKPSKGE